MRVSRSRNWTSHVKLARLKNDGFAKQVVGSFVYVAVVVFVCSQRRHSLGAGECEEYTQS